MVEPMANGQIQQGMFVDAAVAIWKGEQKR